MGRERPLRENLILQACLEAYGAIRREGRLADSTLDRVLRGKRALYSTERRVVAERVYGLLRRQITVDHFLSRTRPGFAALPGTEQDLLRLAASRVLSGEPAQEVAAQTGLPPSDGSVVAGLAEERGELERLDPVQRLSISTSTPEFLASKLIEEFGDQAEPAASALNKRAPLTARTNILKGNRDELITALSRERISARPTPLSPLGIFLETRINAFSLRSFREGRFELQDEGSQLLGMLVDAPPKLVVDACAGAGGKTLQLAAQMKNRGELFALDVSPGRAQELRRRARRAGAHNIRVRLIPADPVAALDALKDLAGRADRVLIDAPCSGTGTLRRNPDARYRLSNGNLEMYVVRQRALLETFSKLVRPGGRMIYGTCSLLREENEQIVQHFLDAHPPFQLKPAVSVIGEALRQTTQNGFLRLAPHVHDTDGFFGAVLERSVSPRARRPTSSAPQQ